MVLMWKSVLTSYMYMICISLKDVFIDLIICLFTCVHGFLHVPLRHLLANFINSALDAFVRLLTGLCDCEDSICLIVHDSSNAFMQNWCLCAHAEKEILKMLFRFMNAFTGFILHADPYFCVFWSVVHPLYPVLCGTVDPGKGQMCGHSDTPWGICCTATARIVKISFENWCSSKAT